MAPSLPDLLSDLFDTTPRPGLQPIPGSKPLTISAALLPPFVYYIALLLLPPYPTSKPLSLLFASLRNVLALTAAFLFFRLPLAYHVPISIGLTYQLGLVGIYGGCRVLDCFFICPYLFHHIPRRVNYNHKRRPETPMSAMKAPHEKEWGDGGLKDPFSGNHVTEGTENLIGKPTPIGTPRTPKTASASTARSATEAELIDSYFPEVLQRAMSGPDPIPVYETARTEPNYPSTLRERSAWALELELSMRGMGFTWTTADVRHTRKTWLPTASNRVHSILVNVMPLLIVCWAIIRTIYTRYLAENAPNSSIDRHKDSMFDHTLPLPLQLLLTAALGAFLMATFSLGHSLFAIMLSPFASFWPQLAFFPPLYTTRIYSIRSVRQFWSYGWHRLFARLFLVWGVWPGEFIERQLTGKSSGQPADVGKVIGAFMASAFVHAFSVRGVLAGDWKSASGEAKFFALNGVAVAVEGVIIRVVKIYRRKYKMPASAWYDAWIGRIWWITVLLFTGRNFARGWVKAGLVREMAFM